MLILMIFYSYEQIDIIMEYDMVSNIMIVLNLMVYMRKLMKIFCVKCMKRIVYCEEIFIIIVVRCYCFASSLLKILILNQL
jgi:hypothetical protein